jgi:hypothetical protein
MAAGGGRFPLDEIPLRQEILKAYHSERKKGGTHRRVLDAIRQLLSGAPGGESFLGNYWFEVDPAASARSFVTDLDKAAPGLATAVLGPVLAAARRREKENRREIAPSVHLLVSSLAGAVAVKSDLGEPLAGAVVAAAFIAVARAGCEPFEAALEGAEPGALPDARA